MGLEDLFDQNHKNRQHGSYGYNRHHDDDDDDRRNSGYYQRKHLLNNDLLSKIWNNKKARVIFIMASIILIIIAIAIVIALIPLLVKFYNYITQNGIQGVVDGTAGFLEKLWKGTEK